MGNSNQQPNKMPNKNDSTHSPKKDEKNFGNTQKEQVRPGQNPNPGNKTPNQK
jgi:hypothetical protein